MTGLACLQCLECEAELGANNQSRTAQEHFGVGEPACHAKKSADAKLARTLKRTARALYHQCQRRMCCNGNFHHGVCVVPLVVAMGIATLLMITVSQFFHS
eukprot:274912-Chlamydomonas_euryale.AAC.1